MITIEFKFPWSMMPLESAGKWSEAVSGALQSTDPLFGKQLFVSARHDLKNCLLVENDTDNTYAIVNYSLKDEAMECATSEIIVSRQALADHLRRDYEEQREKRK
ncbi:hypothetical protein [Halochromatium roseum]|uniref:hypothetical protein n=1 Tax=Halochromatium roseum TaxID=391920 RepID=UPI001913C8D0|nr:hypothetical protein [Halochromatium roseum]